ncbi:transposase [Nocardia gipuzkoensis]
MAAPKNYPDELKAPAVRPYLESDPKPTIRKLAQQLGVHHAALRNWICQADTGRCHGAARRDIRGCGDAIQFVDEPVGSNGAFDQPAEAFVSALIDDGHDLDRRDLQSAAISRTRAALRVQLVGTAQLPRGLIRGMPLVSCHSLGVPSSPSPSPIVNLIPSGLIHWEQTTFDQCCCSTARRSQQRWLSRIQ